MVPGRLAAGWSAGGCFLWLAPNFGATKMERNGLFLTTYLTRPKVPSSLSRCLRYKPYERPCTPGETAFRRIRRNHHFWIVSERLVREFARASGGETARRGSR